MNYVALVRGINVGGSGLLPMKELAALCQGLGFASVRTYIQSGNVLFESKLSEAKARTLIEGVLEARMSRKIQVMLRTREELEQILSRNPFTGNEPAKVGIVFLQAGPPPDLLQKVIAPDGEQIHLGEREIYIYFPFGQGRSKLKMSLDVPTTVRNLNTVTKLFALSGGKA